MWGCGALWAKLCPACAPTLGGCGGEPGWIVPQLIYLDSSVRVLVSMYLPGHDGWSPSG